MNNEQNQVMVLVTAPDQDIGNKIAKALVEAQGTPFAGDWVNGINTIPLVNGVETA